MKFATRFIDLLLPSRCLVSGDIVELQGMVSPQVWRDIAFIGAPFCNVCGQPFDFEVETEMTCAPCLDHPPIFDSARAALKYDDISRDMILKFKHADQMHAVHTFIPWLLKAGHDFLPFADFIIPVPLHPFRLIKRRYNQAAILAKIIAQKSAKNYVPDMLRRVRATPVQGHLGYKERSKNVKDAFVVSPRHTHLAKDKKIVIIDDVYTTGATVNECARVLKKAGASSVHILAVAKVVRD